MRKTVRFSVWFEMGKLTSFEVESVQSVVFSPYPEVTKFVLANFSYGISRNTIISSLVEVLFKCYVLSRHIIDTTKVCSNPNSTFSVF